jgi:hypothetical protein
LREESEGRVYPAALLASVAVEALLLRARQLNITVLTDTRVTEIAPRGAGFTVHAVQAAPPTAAGASANQAERSGKARRAGGASSAQAAPDEPLALPCDRVIVAVGGAAAPVHGTDGSAYGLLTAFGHRLTPLAPALCALTTDPKRIHGLAGQRVRAGLRLQSAGGALLHAASGEALFGEDGVSGIAAMQLARFVQAGAVLCMDLRDAAGWGDALNGGTAGLSSSAPRHVSSPVQADGSRADVTPMDGFSVDQDTAAASMDTAATPVDAVAAHIRRLAALRADCALGSLFTGVFTAPIARLVCREAGFDAPTQPLLALREADIRRLAAAVCGLCLPVTGTRGFAHAQVTAGGVAAADFDPHTMESKLQRGLYAAGEVLDVDGDCGGYNLMFAFASGLLAGRAG